jgi:glycerol-3-phosphate cytidylyltransferase
MRKTVITYGTFDMFHVGHLNLINRASQLGNRLIVAVSTDRFNSEKGKRCLVPYSQRAEIVGAIKRVDLVIPEDGWAQKSEDISKYGVDVFVIGDDWAGRFDSLKSLCEVVYLPRTQNVSTTELKASLKSLSSPSLEDLQKAFEVLEILRADFGD